MRDASRESEQYRGMPDVPAEHQPKLKLVGKAIAASAEEIATTSARAARACELRSDLMTIAQHANRFCWSSCLRLVCVISAIALIYTKHESRKLFVELETLTHERDELNIEWGQLQIEQSTWATHCPDRAGRNRRPVAGATDQRGNLRNRAAMTRGAETKTQTAKRFVGRVTLVSVFFGVAAVRWLRVPCTCRFSIQSS